MRLPTRNGTGRGTPRNPRITQKAKAEVDLMQTLLVTIGQEALRQNGMTCTPTLPLAAGGHIATVDGTTDVDEIELKVTLTVRVSARSSAVIGTVPTHQQ